MNRRSRLDGGLSPRRRFFVLALTGLFLAFVFGILIFRLYFIQVKGYSDFKIVAVEQQIKDNTIPANRGAIYDSTGKVLARSTVVWDIICDPFVLQKPEAVRSENILPGTNRSNMTETEKKYVGEAAGKLAALLGLERDVVYEKLTADNKYQVLAKKVEKNTVDEIKKIVAEANKGAEKTVINMSYEQNSKREYPYGAYLSTVLGFCNDDGAGFYGLEKYYDTVLSGTDGRSLTEENAWGYEISQDNSTTYDALDGYNLHLTINNTIQSIAQKYIDAAVARYNVQNRACAVVMEVKTGRILALANTDNYDPNEPKTLQEAIFQDALANKDNLSDLQISRLKNRLGETTVIHTEKVDEKTVNYTISDVLEDGKIEDIPDTSNDEYSWMLGTMREAQWKNKAITELYMPGSVFKIMTTSAGLDSGKINTGTGFYCPGYLAVADHTYRCADFDRTGTGHGAEDLSLGLQNSCNVYYIQVGQTVGAQGMYDYFKAFGFTEVTGVDLPYETPWMQYYTPDRMGATELASTSFGQAQAVTPMQMCAAVSAAVNGGYLVTPYLVDYITDSSGNVVETTQTHIKRQVISEEVSETVRSLMHDVMGSSGKNAQVPGYDMGGKSGTTEQLNKSLRGDGDYKKVSSFVGVLPINDPEILVYVMLDDPRSYNDFASQIVAPVVGNIVSEVAPYLGLETNADTEVTGNVQVPYILEYDVGSAQAKLNQNKFEHRLVGSGSTVVAQYPVAGATVPAGSTIYIYSETEELMTTTVPTVTGMKVGQAKQTLAAAGLNVSVLGSVNGTVQSQDADPGTTLPMGSVVAVEVVDTSTGE